MGTIAGFNTNSKLWLQCPMSQLKQRRGKNRVCGPYHIRRQLITGSHPGRGFYLDSDFQPFSRWTWADQVAGAGIRHTGWFTDGQQNETIRGIVARLPHGLFMAGWSMGEGMASEVDATVFDSEVYAAFVADSMAERAAENEREYQEREEAEREEEEQRLAACQGGDAEELEGY